MNRLVSPWTMFFSVLAIATFAAVFWWSRQRWLQLMDPAVVTGYTLFATMILLALFNARKRLSMVPLGRARVWLRLHVVGGLLALAMFWLHSGTLWPTGFYEQVLAGLFYFVSLTGIAGILLQRMLPRRLTETGIEVMYERIPWELAEIREKVEALVLECTEKAGSKTVAQHYLATLDWFFRRPRFLVSHLMGGDAAAHWLRGPGSAASRYLNDVERRYFSEIMELASVKRLIDRHYVCQAVMKTWLFLHVPLSAAVLAFAVWHLLLVNIYGL